MSDRLIVRGAREHNLRSVDLDLPRDKLIVFTGLSGSGKSSLAFDTIYAEGQRRYVESLSAYARQFLGQMDKPDVDFIEGLSPAISIDQKSAVAQPPLDGRHHHRGLRLPPAAVRPHRRAPLPRVRRRRHPPDAPADRRPRPRAARGHPLPGAGAGRAGPQGHLRDAARRPRRPGLRPGPGRRRPRRARRRRDRRPGPLRAAHDRGRRRPPRAARGHRAPAHRLARDGAAAGRGRGRGRDRRPRRREARRRRRDAHLHPAPRLPERPRQLRGAGAPQLLVQLALRRLRALRRPRHPLRGRPRAGRARTPTSSIDEGAIAPWAGGHSQYFQRLVESACARRRASPPTRRGQTLPAEGAARSLLHGKAGTAKVLVKYRNRYGRTRTYHANYEGVIPYLQRRHTEAESDTMREQIEGYMREVPCPACGGARLKPLSLGRHRSTAATSPRSATCRSARRPSSSAASSSPSATA